MQKIALRKEGFLFGGKEKEVREPARPISACTILILCNSHKHASKKSKKKSPRTEWPVQGVLTLIERRKLHLCSAAHSSAATVIDGSKVLVFTPHRLTRSSSMTPSSLYLLPSIMYYTTNRTFLQVFLKIRLTLYAATPQQLRFDFPRSPEFQQLRNFRRRCSFCPYFL